MVMSTIWRLTRIAEAFIMTANMNINPLLFKEINITALGGLVKPSFKTMKKCSNSVYTLLAVVFGKLLCRVGWHNFTCKMQDCIDEFGYIPNDGRMPKVAKCIRCGKNYR